MCLSRLNFVDSTAPKGTVTRRLCGGEAEEQHGPVKRAVRNTPTRLPVEAVNQLLPDFASLSGCAGAAQKQRQQVGGARRLHVAVRLERLQGEPRRGDKSRQPPHDVWCVHQITRHRLRGRLQRIALEQGNGESCEIAIEYNELPTRPENPPGLC